MEENTDPFKEVPVDQFFPELRKWFAFLNAGYKAGATWQSLLIAHASQIGRQRSLTVSSEIHQLQSVELTMTDVLFENLLCGVLGLDMGIPAHERYTVQGFLALMDQELTTLA